MAHKLFTLMLIGSLLLVGAWSMFQEVNSSHAVTGNNQAIPMTTKLDNITIPPQSLPSVTYYYGNQGGHQTITTPEWNSILKNVFDNKTIISYDFANNTTQALILFDITYTYMNPYGNEYVAALGQIGPLNTANEQKAFWMTANKSSQVSGYSNWGALNVGAYPGFSWSKPQILPSYLTEEYFAIFGAVVASIFVLYFVFNRRK
ncbi:MAG: hypothetical protein ACYCUZ_05005 [Cuniculiplasma sp.]